MSYTQLPTPPRVVSRTTFRVPGRALTAALEHVTRGGLPPLLHQFELIKRGVASGRYDSNRSELITELRRDPGSYTWVLRSLRRYLPDAARRIHPEQHLRTLDAGDLRRLFNATPESLSLHRGATMSRPQALRLQHSLISAHTAAALAREAALDEGAAFTAAMLRQLGLNLIAWNYPQQYAQALLAQRRGESTIEERLERLLGISPKALGRTLAASWELPPEVLHTLDAAGTPVPLGQVRPLSLHEVCELAELFARANDPLHYPRAGAEWSETAARLADTLASRITATLGSELTVALAPLAELRPDDSPPALLPRAQRGKSHPLPGEILLGRNEYVRRCSPAVKDLVALAYRQIPSIGAPAVPALKTVVEVIAPRLGFSAGCLYLMNERAQTLQPALRFGDRETGAYPALRVSKGNMVTTSLDTEVPVVAHHPVPTGEREQIAIAGGIAASRHRGVLYLEVTADGAESTEAQSLIHFQVLRQTLMDVLGMSGK